MADSDISFSLAGVPSGVITPRTRDRGGNTREPVHSLADSAGNLIDPASNQLQVAGNSTLTSINGKLPALVTGRLPVDNSGVTQPVSATTLPLPSGAATSANQSAANTSLTSIDTKTPALVGGAVPVSLGTATFKAANTAAAATDPALVVAISPNSVNANGRAAAAASAPVVLSNEDSANQSAALTFHLVAAATTNATVVKASPGNLRGYYIYNSNAAARKVAFHDSATTPTAGASVKFSIVIPPSSGANLIGVGGVSFTTGIAITTTTGLADNDTTAVGAADLVLNLWYV